MSRKIKNILVTGSGGFIGGHLVKRLLKDGYNVVGVDIKPLEIWFQKFEVNKQTHFLLIKHFLNIQLTVAPITKPILAVVKSPFKVPSANPTTAPTYQLLKSLANVKVSSSSFLFSL